MSRPAMIGSRVIAAGALALAALGAAAGCSDGPTTPARDQLRVNLVVSDPVAVSPAAEVLAGPAPAAAAAEVSYVSLPPGSVPGGTTASIRNLATGASVSAVVTDGGFDPVAIGATAGDELAIQVSGPGGVIASLTVKVPPRRPPKVVRVDPPRGKADVPLNSRISVVFSEPVDPATVTTATVQLLANGQPVAGAVQVDASGLAAVVVPAALLSGNTEYTLVVQGVRDRSGDALEAPVTSQFVTRAPFPRIAFASTRDGTAHIYVTDADGSVRRLTDGSAPDEWPTWSPDGRRIAFERGGDSRSRGIYAVNADGSGLRTLVGSGLPMFEPAWSPDGARVLGSAGRDLLVLNLDGSGVRQLPVPAELDGVPIAVVSHARWSPDGQRIVLVVALDFGDFFSRVAVMNIDGTGIRRLTPTTGVQYAECFPAWSPDGRQIALWSFAYGVAVTDADRAADPVPVASKTDLPTQGCLSAHPDWSPDGRMLAVVARDAQGKRSISAVDLRTGVVRRLVPPSGGEDFDPAWSPVQP